MAIRIFYALLAIAALYLSYDIYKISSGRSAVHEVESQYAYEPEAYDLNVTEFLDYTCGYCREIHPTIMAAVKQDGRVRYVPRALPSQNEESVHNFIYAHKAAEYGKYIEMHEQLMKNFRPITKKIFVEMALTAGMPEDNFTADVDGQIIQDRLKENMALFRKFGGTVTPTFVIGKNLVYTPEDRLPTVDDFLTMFAQARAAQ